MSRHRRSNESLEGRHVRISEWPPWFQTGTASQGGAVLAGLHPLGLPLLGEPGATCGNCKFSARKVRAKTVYKCLKHHTGGPATDIRLKWAACERYKQRLAYHAGS